MALAALIELTIEHNFLAALLRLPQACQPLQGASHRDNRSVTVVILITGNSSLIWLG